MNEPAERRRLLVMEADLHRRRTSLERASLRERPALRHWRKLAGRIPAALTAPRRARPVKAE